MILNLLNIFLICLLQICVSREVVSDENGNICTTIKNCKHVLDILQKKPLTKEDKDLVLSLKCGFDGTQPLVWCSNPEVRNVSLFNMEICGFAYDMVLIIGGGVDSDPDEFPWMAMLEYRDRRKQLKPKCGGTLIHSKYVLTAAHCLLIPASAGILESVLLGEFDTIEESGSEKRVKVEKYWIHPLYAESAKEGLHHHDVGIVKLNEIVKFTDFIKPICLPSTNDKLSLKQTYTVAGWGLTEKATVSTKLQKLVLRLMNSDNCTKLLGYNVVDTQTCAGGEEGKDSCKGDSGGPLMTKQPPGQVTQVGIISLSIGRGCGVGRPNIYTDLRKYVHWITNVLQTEESKTN